LNFTIKNIRILEKKASEIRIRALEDAVRAGKGHLGGAFSCVELLVSLYYGEFIRISSDQPKDPNRDFFIMGKGHACLSLYPILLDLGFITKERYLEYGKNGSSLGGQLDVSIPGVEYNTGSLGHALGICAGVAKAAKMDSRASRAIALVGDAECDEGAIWEAVMFAAEQKLNNLVCIIDRNRLSVTQVIESDVLFGNFKKKMNLFKWDCHVIDGHNYNEIFEAFDKATVANKPTMILANTIKGKGVSFMENDVKWHHTMPSENEIKIAREELGITSDNI
jgi:transketolase